MVRRPLRRPRLRRRPQSASVARHDASRPTSPLRRAAIWISKPQTLLCSSTPAFHPRTFLPRTSTLPTAPICLSATAASTSPAASSPSPPSARLEAVAILDYPVQCLMEVRQCQIATMIESAQGGPTPMIKCGIALRESIAKVLSDFVASWEKEGKKQE